MIHRPIFTPWTRAAFGLCLALSVLATGALAQPNRQFALEHINQLMHQGRRAEALPLCRQYATDFPADARMLYNLACLENTVGDKDRAEDTYVRALAAGFNEFEQAAADPDLQGDLHNVIVSLNEGELARLAELSASQALALDRDTWSEPRKLIPHGMPVAMDSSAVSAPVLRLQWLETGLELAVTADSGWATALDAEPRAPWNGGSGLLVSLSIPDGSSAWESANHFLFAFGTNGKTGVGGMFISSQGHWQPVAEMVPKIKADGAGGVSLKATIPWTAILPYDPVVDTPLGLNATLIAPGGPHPRRASLVETADTMNPVAARRRFATLVLRTDSIDGDQFTGKMNDSLSRDKPLTVDLVAISSMVGQATLKLDFIDQAGHSVLPNGPLTGRISLEKGTNNLQRQADFRSLRAGGYILQAELTFPTGRVLKWGAAVLHLPENWQDRFRQDINQIALNEQPTVRYLLDQIQAAVASHLPRRNPGPIVATLMEVDQMLAGAEDTGTILPAKGSCVMIYPGPQGQDRLCRIYLPAGREYVDAVNPVLVLGYGGGQEARLADRIGRNYEFGKQRPTLKTGQDDRFPIYLVPELRPTRSNQAADLAAEAQACRVWAKDYFQAQAVSLVGIDAVAATALEITKQDPRSVRALLVFAGSGLDPWPQAQPEFLRRKLGPPPAEFPVTWLDFSMETAHQGQAPAILQALRDLGYEISDLQNVPGSLSLTQVADRTVLWAEGLRREGDKP